MMTHEGKISAPWEQVTTELGLVTRLIDLGFPCTYKKSAHGAPVLAAPNLCLFDISTDSDRSAELLVHPDVEIIWYQEIIEEITDVI